MKQRILMLLFSILFLSPAGSVSAANITPAEAYKKISNDKDIIVLDVRTSDEWRDGHIRDSVLIDIRGQSFDKEIKTLDKSKTYIVYCRSGVRSALAEEKLNAAGIKNTFNMTGGFLKWRDSSLPIER